MFEPMVDDFALVLRGTAVGFTLVLALASARLPGRGRIAFLPLVICLAAYLVRSAPQFSGMERPALLLLLPLSVGALLFPVAFWWLVHNAFADRHDVPWPVWVAMPLLLVAGFMPDDSVTLGVAPQALQKLLAAGFVAAALWRIGTTAAGDLVPGRRRLRAWLLGYIGLHGLVVLGVELWLQGRAAAGWMDQLNVAVIAAVLGIVIALFLRFDSAAAHMLFGDETSRRPDPLPRPLAQAEAASQAADTAADAEWVQRLQQLMTAECVYRDPELSLGGLARRLGLPEYRLREVIHERLGYRNFPAFVNEHRLQEVERKLADPSFDRRPILTLALEAGFGSIGPFNRAFRERHGSTPTAFRSRREAVPAK